MKNKVWLLIAAVALCLSISSCDSNPASPEGNNLIRPLAIGNYWIYNKDTSSVIFPLLYSDTMRVVSYENLNGNQAYGMKINSDTTLKLYFANKNGGQYFYQLVYHDSTSSYNPKMYIKYPINLNDTIVGPYDGKMKCVSLSSGFNGFSGCIELKEITTGFDINYHEYWKPGIGLIGAEYDYNGKHYLNRLTSYHIE